MPHQPAVYIMASNRNGTLYIGATSDLPRRVWQHRNGSSHGFTNQYSVKKLVYYELHDEMYQAITREKRLKKWLRAWKIRIIETDNPLWRDLWDDIRGF